MPSLLGLGEVLKGESTNTRRGGLPHWPRIAVSVVSELPAKAKAFFLNCFLVNALLPEVVQIMRLFHRDNFSMLWIFLLLGISGSTCVMRED